ncbi:MAG: hypothetical protein KatS3mg076_0156 [Candidatus Binatia bacterium]|nr:MAG: hypothetical protein KatS3mg076_0156 [Candidatus Binatia bacterium]
MRVRFLPERREVEVSGVRRVADLLRELDVLPGTVLVIRNDELLGEHDVLDADDEVEIRSVLSGG